MITPNPIYNEEGKYIVHNVPQAVIDHVPEDVKDVLDLRPMQMLDFPEDSRVVFSMGRNTGKSLKTSELLEGLRHDFDGDAAAYLDHIHLTHLYGQPDQPFDPSVPTFTWTEHYPREDPLMRLTVGYMGEARRPADRWLGEGFKLGYYGYQAKKLWDHAEWLGLGKNENEYLDTFQAWRCLRVTVPARRYAGLHAYELSDLFYLRMPKPLDWSREEFEHETRGWQPGYPPGVIVIDRPELVKPGQVVSVKYVVQGGRSTCREYHCEQVGTALRPSERRAKYSSTMDGNGKPRRRAK
jgi:hypothetical protein